MSQSHDPASLCSMGASNLESSLQEVTSLILPLKGYPDMRSVKMVRAELLSEE